MKEQEENPRLVKLREDLKNIVVNGGDEECDHVDADALLIEYINDPQVTETYQSIPKWYA